MALALVDPHVKENLDTAAGHIGEQIAGNGSVVVGHKIYCGMFESNKLIPLKYMPLEFSLTIDPDAVGEALTGAFTISDTQPQSTLLGPTSDVAETLHATLNNSKALPIHYQSWY